MLLVALNVAISMAPTVQAAPAATTDRSPVAVVWPIAGTVWVEADTGSRRVLTLYEWVPAGAIIEVGPRSRAKVILIDGQRFELGAGAQVRVSSAGLVAVRGPITKGRSLPPLPSLGPLASTPPADSGAVRIRGRAIAALNPCLNVRTLADETVLRFDPIAGASRYEVEMTTATGTRVLARIVDSVPVRVPARTLAPGSEYHWSVHTASGTVPAEGAARFTTVDSQTAARRATLIRELTRTGETALAAIVDARLGLLNQAIAELESHLRRTPTDRAARAALRDTRAQLRGACR